MARRTQKTVIYQVEDLENKEVDDIQDDIITQKKQLQPQRLDFLQESKLHYGHKLPKLMRINQVNRRIAQPKLTARKIVASNNRKMQRKNVSLTNNQNGNTVHSKGNARTKRLTREMKSSDYTTKDEIQGRLKNKSAWFNSVVSPLEHGNVKIPDETGLQTATVQLVERHTVTSGASGMAGIRVTSPYINSTNKNDVNGSNYQYLNQFTSSSNIVDWWDGLISPGEIPFTINQKFKDLAEFHRIVSAEVSLVPQMSGLNNQGTMIAFIHPYQCRGNSFPVSNYLNRFGSSTVSINSNEAAYARWVPISVEQQTYKAFFPLDLTSKGPGDQEAPFWCFGIIAEGCVPLSTFVATIVVNYEYSPNANTIDLVESSPSPQDTQEEDMVKVWIQDEPVTGQVKAADVEKAPQATDLPQGGDTETGFGMIENVIKEILPIAAGILSIL